MILCYPTDTKKKKKNKSHLKKAPKPDIPCILFNMKIRMQHKGSTFLTLSRSFPVPNTKPASMFPIPVANWPNAPAVHVCESVPKRT